MKTIAEFKFNQPNCQPYIFKILKDEASCLYQFESLGFRSPKTSNLKQRVELALFKLWMNYLHSNGVILYANFPQELKLPLFLDNLTVSLEAIVATNQISYFEMNGLDGVIVFNDMIIPSSDAFKKDLDERIDQWNLRSTIDKDLDFFYEKC